MKRKEKSGLPYPHNQTFWFLVINTLQKYKKTDNNSQLLISSYLAGNKSKDLYNKINETLYKNYKDGVINKKQYQNIIDKL